MLRRAPHCSMPLPDAPLSLFNTLLPSTIPGSVALCLTGSRDYQLLHTSTRATGKVKITAREDMPEGWKWGENQKQNRLEYNKAMVTYRRQLAALRNAWRPLVDEHNEEVRLSSH
jgi:hypothetical protein